MRKLTSNNHRGINKAFTLIELLAVIVIFAVIALIATPIVLSILTKVRKSAFQDSAYGIMEAAKASYIENILEESNPVDQVFSFDEGATNELSYSGSKPKGGILTLSKSGEIGLAIHNNEWCAIKSKTDTDVRLIKYDEDTCVIEENQNDSVITLNGDSTIYVEIGGTYNELGATVKIEGGKYTTEIKLENEIVSSIDTSRAGVYTITYNFNDESAIRKVVVLDMKPVIKMSEENEAYVKEKDILLNVSGIQSNKVESFIYEVKKDGVSIKTETVNGLTKTLTLNETGNYEVIVTVKDNNNHENTLTSSYKIDATKPTIEIPENTKVKTTEVTGYDLLTGVTVSDNTGITPTVKTSGSLNTSLGEQTVEYQAIDEAGNIETVTRKFTIVEADGPILNFSSIGTDGWTQALTIKATATDNSNLGNFTYEVVKDNVSKGIKNVTVSGKSSEVDIPLNETGVYKINLAGNDEHGNNTTLSSGTYNIDVTKPTYTVKSTEVATIKKGESNVITNYFNNPVWSVSGTGTVVCKNGSTVVTNTDSLDVGTHTITCTATGKTNLVASASKSIEVKNPQTGLEVITNNDVGENGSIRTDNLGNKRYAGSNPNNWVCFGTQNETCDEEHLYRIIGIIDGKMKIIKNSFYSTDLRWDTTGGEYGSSNWDRPADLKTELNGPSFYSNTNYIDEISRSYIENGTWYTGGIKSTYTLETFEDTERSSLSLGYIGLMSVTDLGYGSNDASCERTTNLNTVHNACINNNYLFDSGTYQWTITPNSLYPNRVWFGAMLSVGCTFTNLGRSVRPSLFLKPEVKIISGKGTEQEPYRLSM